MMRRVLVTVLWGALVGGALAAGLFLVASLLDGTRLGEALGYSLVAGTAGGLLGAVAGAAVGVGNFGLLGGALSGLLVALGVVAFYVFGFSRVAEVGRFLGESRVIILVLGVPLVLTGMAAAWLMNRAPKD